MVQLNVTNMAQSLKRFGHRSHIGGNKRGKNLIKHNQDRWDVELKIWLKKYKKNETN